LAGKKVYESPEVGTVFPLSSDYAENVYVDLVKKIACVLEDKELISETMKPKTPLPTLQIKLCEYMGKFPVRRHKEHWIDGGNQVAVFNPNTFLPFFLNPSGSKIIRLCDGKTKTGEIMTQLRKEWNSIPGGVLVKDLMQFMLLLEELDLIEFAE
jgi:hypothetical protein